MDGYNVVQKLGLAKTGYSGSCPANFLQPAYRYCSPMQQSRQCGRHVAMNHVRPTWLAVPWQVQHVADYSGR